MLTERVNYDIIILVHEKRGQKRKVIKKDINNRIEREEKINKTINRCKQSVLITE